MSLPCAPGKTHKSKSHARSCAGASMPSDQFRKHGRIEDPASCPPRIRDRGIYDHGICIAVATTKKHCQGTSWLGVRREEPHIRCAARASASSKIDGGKSWSGGSMDGGGMALCVSFPRLEYICLDRNGKVEDAFHVSRSFEFPVLASGKASILYQIEGVAAVVCVRDLSGLCTPGGSQVNSRSALQAVIMRCRIYSGEKVSWTVVCTWLEHLGMLNPRV